MNILSSAKLLFFCEFSRLDFDMNLSLRWIKHVGKYLSRQIEGHSEDWNKQDGNVVDGTRAEYMRGDSDDLKILSGAILCDFLQGQSIDKV